MTTKDYGVIRTTRELEVLQERLLATDHPIGFDIETSYPTKRERGALSWHSGAFVTGFSITDNPSWARYVPLRHEVGPNLEPDEVWELMSPVLTAKRLVCHNAKFEALNMGNEGVELGILGDSMLMAYCIGRYKDIGLKDLTKKIFKHDQKEIESLFPGMTKKDKNRMQFHTLEVTQQVADYACEDAAWCLQHYHNFLPMLQGTPQERVYRLEMLVLEVLIDMERRGVSVDWDAIALARAEAQPFHEQFEVQVKNEFAKLTGRPMLDLNLRSVPQLRDLLYNELAIPVTRRTDKESPSTDAVALNTIAKTNVAVQQLLEYREVENLIKRFDLWLEKDKSKPATKGLDGKTHPNYAQHIVAAGRFSASDPAIQQLPKKWHWELEGGGVFEGNFRNFIVASPGTYLLGFDYSQIELRVLAGLANEPVLLDAFTRDLDVHTITAAMMLGKSPRDVDKETERPIGKTMNFALIYGMGPKSLAERLAIAFDRAKELYQSYFENFPGVTTWLESTKAKAKEERITISWFGRKVRIWEFDSDNPKVRSKGERLSTNAPVQGGAADVMKLTMARVRKVLKDAGWWNTKVWMTMNQHDALMFEVDQSLDPHQVVEVLRPVVEKEVSDIFPPFRSDWEFGYRWGSMIVIERDTRFVRDEATHWQVEGEAVLVVRDDEDDERVVEFDVEMYESYVQHAISEEVDPQVVVELTEMPEESRWLKFIDYVNTIPGRSQLIVVTPEGRAELELRTGLSVSHQPRVSLLLGGARVSVPRGAADLSTIKIGDA